MRTRVSSLLSLSLSLLVAWATLAPTAIAAEDVQGPNSCISEYYYDTPANGRTTGWRGTNRVSAQLAGPGTINWTQSGTVTQTFGANASFSVSASAIVASANATFGASYTYATSSQESWSYTIAIPAGKTGVLAILHRNDRLTTNKWVLLSNCTWKAYPFYSYIPRAATDGSDFCVMRDLLPLNYTSWRAQCVSES